MRQLFFFLTLCVSLFAFSQSRENAATSFTVLEIGAPISYPTGWCYDEAAQKWCGYSGTIDAKYKNNSKTPLKLSGYNMSFHDNIKAIHTEKIAVKDSTYYLVCVENYWGEWKYPALQRDWQSQLVYDIYLITNNEFAKLKNLSDGIVTINILNNTSVTGFTNYSSVAAKNKIKEAVNYFFKTPITPEYIARQYKHPAAYHWYVKKEDEQTYRFQKPTLYELLNISLETLNQDIDVSNPSRALSIMNMREKSLHCPNFYKGYFEVGAPTFGKLLLD